MCYLNMYKSAEKEVLSLQGKDCISLKSCGNKKCPSAKGRKIYKTYSYSTLGWEISQIGGRNCLPQK